MSQSAYILTSTCQKFQRELAAEATSEPYWITRGPDHDHEKVLGPFVSKDLAIKVRTYVEKVEGHENYWVEQEGSF